MVATWADGRGRADRYHAGELGADAVASPLRVLRDQSNERLAARLGPCHIEPL